MAIIVANVELTHTFDYWRNRHNELAQAVGLAVTTNSPAAVGDAAITGTFISNGVIVNNAISNVTITPAGITTPTITSNTGIFANLNVVTMNVATFSTNALFANTGSFIDSVTVGNSSINTFITPTSITISPSIYGNNSIYLANSSANVTINPPTLAESGTGQHYLNANGSWSTVAAVYNPISNGQVTIPTGVSLIDSFAMAAFEGAEYTIHVKDDFTNNQYFTKLLITHNNINSFFTDYGGVTPNNSVGIFSSGVIGANCALYFNNFATSATVKFARIVV